MPRCFEPKKYRKIGGRIYELGEWYPTKAQAENGADMGMDENMVARIVKSGSGWAFYWRYENPSQHWLKRVTEGYRRGQ